MKKRERGILSVETSIVLTLLTLFTLFLFSFIRIYRAENMVSHATLQAADAMALESYLRENARDDRADDVVYLASRLTGSLTLNADSFESLRSANVPTLAKEKFIAAVADSEVNADSILKDFGVKDGISGIDFSSSKMDLDNNDVIVSVSYTLKMQFPIFGAEELSVTKSAKAKTFGDILFEIIAEAEDSNMGSTSGSGNYKHGETVKITAIPNYGYKFVKWDDGETANPRTVSVTEAHKYIAIFEADEFGIITFVSPEDAGVASGAGTYTYQSEVNLKATSNPGYYFDKWSVYKHTDYTTSFRYGNNVTQKVDQSYTYTAYFTPNTYTIKVATSGANGSVSIKSGSQSGTSLKLSYGSSFNLSQTAPYGYTFKGWKITGGSEFISAVSNFTVPCYYPNGSQIPNNATITYTAYYEKTKFKVSVDSAGNGKVSLDGKNYSSSVSKEFAYGSAVTVSVKPDNNYTFDYWNSKSSGLPQNYKFTISGNSSFKAYFRKSNVSYTLNCNKGRVYIGKYYSTYTKTINYKGSTGSLPCPIREGYIFAGWKYNGNSYSAGSKVNNITSNITLVAQWKKCNHIYSSGKSSMDGYCGYMHYVNPNRKKGAGTFTWGVTADHPVSHECKWATCVVCSKCGYHKLETSDKYLEFFSGSKNKFAVADTRWCGTCAEDSGIDWLKGKKWIDVHSIGENQVEQYLKNRKK